MNWFEGKKILVPIDFGDRSHAAIDAALEMVVRPADLHVIHVAPDLAAMAPEVIWQEITDESRRDHIETSFKSEYRDNKYQPISFHVAFGDPGRKVTDYAQEIGADVIVMPSHGRTGLSRLLIGSVAERVLRLAHCPVLVLRS